MKTIAHRGHGSQPENTMRAFRTGHSAGADRVELDIQKSADGDYVVIHDPTVDRTTNGKGKVGELSTARLRSLDAGKGEKLPLFTEVVDWAVREDVALAIEVKHPHEGDEAALATTVRNSGLRDPWVISFDGAFVERFEDCAPEVTTGILVHERPLFDKTLLGAAVGLFTGVGAALAVGLPALAFAGVVAAQTVAGAVTGYKWIKAALRRKDLGRDADMHIPGKRIVSRKVVEKAHRLGKDVAVYTIDSAKKAKKLAAWGVDGLISNYPERVRT